VQQVQACRDDSLSSLGPAESTTACGLLLKQLRLTQEWLQHLIESPTSELSIGDNLRRTLALQGHGVVTLMIIGSIGVRYQDGRLPAGRQFC